MGLLSSFGMTNVHARRNRRIPWSLVCIVVIATVLRLAIIDRDALWLDEGYSWWDARQSFASLWSLVPQCDPHPPLYFALLHAWIALFGDGTIAMRALSALLGIATVVVVYFAGSELDAARAESNGYVGIFGVANLAALLFALTPFQIYFSIEARPYALLCFGAALLTLGSLKVVRSAGNTQPSDAATRAGPFRHRSFFGHVSRGGWSTLVVGAAVVVWTNNTAVLLLGAVSAAFIALWLFDRSQRRTVRPLIAAGVVVLLLWAPDLPLLVSQMREVSEDFWIPPPTLQGFTFELHYLIGLDAIGAVWWMALAMIGGLALLWRRIGWQLAVMVGALAILPVVFNVAISVAFKPILISRALIVATPAMVLALAAAVVLVKPRALRLSIAAGMIAAHAIASAALLRADHVKEPWKAIVARLATQAREATILVVPNEIALPLAHEAKAGNVSLKVRGVPADFPATGMKARYPSGKCAPSVVGLNHGPLIDNLRAESDVILLTRRNNTYDPDEAIVAALRSAGFRLQSDEVFQPGDLRLMRFSRTASQENRARPS